MTIYESSTGERFVIHNCDDCGRRYVLYLQEDDTIADPKARAICQTCDEVHHAIGVSTWTPLSAAQRNLTTEDLKVVRKK